MPVQGELVRYSGAEVRYSGADNAKLLAPERAARFQEYLQVCCNLHRGKDYKYIKDIFFPILNLLEKENVCDMMHVLNTYSLCIYSVMCYVTDKATQKQT